MCTTYWSGRVKLDEIGMLVHKDPLKKSSDNVAPLLCWWRNRRQPDNWRIVRILIGRKNTFWTERAVFKWVGASGSRRIAKEEAKKKAAAEKEAIKAKMAAMGIQDSKDSFDSFELTYDLYDDPDPPTPSI